MTSYDDRAGAGAVHHLVPEVPLAVRDLRRSAEPAVVLSSLARSSVPSFSDGCHVELSEGLEPMFRVSYPLAGDESAPEGHASYDDDSQPAWAAHNVVTTSFEIPSTFGRPSSAGLMIHSWNARIPTASEAIIARLLVDEALALVRHERLAEVAAQADRRSAQLAVETITARTIGEATGIVMATRHLTNSAAVDLLKVASRHSGRTLRDLAYEVVHAGGLTYGPNEPAASLQRDSARAPNLRSVP
jgi:hypothetical protein